MSVDVKVRFEQDYYSLLAILKKNHIDVNANNLNSDLRIILCFQQAKIRETYEYRAL
jgi:hypothetical protein